MRRLLPLSVLLPAMAGVVAGQTTQGLISGRILDSVSGRPLAGCIVAYSGDGIAGYSGAGASAAFTGTVRSDDLGFYFIPLLSPGSYVIRVSDSKYQAQEIHELSLAVAGRIEIDFKLRPLSDVWEAGQYRSVFLPGTHTIVTFYGPDVDTSRSGSFDAEKGSRGTLDTSQSYVIDPEQIELLPLEGRDVYTMLVSLPGVTADQATGRGIGVSVAGSRPSASNFLLDGVENNNYLVTGPLNPVAPEAVAEYRISTNNYSAQYGQTSGFVANAVTRAGTNQFHGLGYEYLINDALDAADFQDNVAGTGRLADKENRFGYQVGGPVLHDRLFFSSALEQFISHGQQSPETFLMPTSAFSSILNLPTSSPARQLLTQFPSPVNNSSLLESNYTVKPPTVIDQLVALERGDYILGGGRDHIMGRVDIARLNEPDFIWSPYSAFTSGLNENTTGLAANWMRSWSPRLTSELKFGYSDDDLWWNRAQPQIPTLVSTDNVTLPGSPAFYAYRNRNKSAQPIFDATWTRNRHVITAGAGGLFRYNSGYLTAGQDGEYIFGGAIDFAFDIPSYFRASIDRLAPTPTQPDFNRDYQYDQFFLFIEDSYRVSPRLTLNLGLRYENFGSPANTGATKDALVELGAGADFNQRIANATLAIPNAGSETLFASDNGDFAPRFGISWDPFGKGNTVLRGGYGIFYDRPFDNLWQNTRNNNIVLPLYTASPGANYLAPISSALPLYANQPVANDFPSLTLMDPNLRNGYAQQFFAGIEHSFGENLSVQVNGTGTLGRRLITTDLVNRQFTTDTGDGRPNESLPDIAWRSSQGLSDYYALNTLARYRVGQLELQAAYTWSHSIDNQSEPLIGDFFNLDFTAIGAASTTGEERSAFAQMFNSNGDRGNSDFDQRQNVFLLGVWRSGGRRWFTRGWQTSYMAAFRTGFPYTVYSVTTQAPVFGDGLIENQRADLLSPSTAFFPTPIPVSGGIAVLNSAAFAEPVSASTVGNTGRNAFRGPGLYNVDLSIGRAFAIPFIGEGGRVVLRADLFNILNHANLNNPVSLFGSPDFGVETWGRQGVASGFPATVPLNETARRVQVLLRLEF